MFVEEEMVSGDFIVLFQESTPVFCKIHPLNQQKLH